MDPNQQQQPDMQQAAPAAQPRQQYVQQPLPNMPQAPASLPKDLFDEMVKLRQEIAARDAELAKRDKLAEETKASVAKLTEQVALTESQKKELEATRRAESIRTALKLAAMEHQAIDPDEVIALTASQFTVADDGSVVTAGSNPQPASAFVKSFLEKKPHLAKPRVATGSGASPYPAAAPNAEPTPVFDIRTPEGATAMLRHNLQKFIRPR
jgi:hypothetical protein